MKNYGIILASGLGTRFSNETPKQFIKIAGKTIIEHTIDAFEQFDDITNIIVVITPNYRYILDEILLKNNYKKITSILNGGDTRKESSYIAISSITDIEANLIIHDCARPFLSQRIVSDCINALKTYDAVDVAIPSGDTIIEIDSQNIIKNIPKRAFMLRGQTPQCFKLSLIKKAHEMALNDNEFSDDCGLVVKYDLSKVYVVDGEEKNIKITHPTDIFLADKLFQVNKFDFRHQIDFTQLEGKVIVIFGGFSGIGESIQKLASINGAKVFCFSRQNNCDITKINSIYHILSAINSKLGKIDYIVNTSGILSMGKLSERNADEIVQEISVNYIGAVNVCKASVEYLKNSRGGLLLFASSSYTRGRALYSTYSSTKAATVNLTQALAEEWYNDGVRINVISPERSATPMRFNAFGKEPVESLLDPEKVADISLKTLLSSLTGQVIDVRK